MKQFIAAIDFDGTLIEDTWPNEGQSMPGAAVAMQWLMEHDCRVVVWTCRTELQIPANNPYSSVGYVYQWLTKNGLGQYIGDRIKVNENFPDVVQSFGGAQSRKVFANVYVDDRALGGFVGWAEALPLLQEAIYQWKLREHRRQQAVVLDSPLIRDTAALAATQPSNSPTERT